MEQQAKTLDSMFTDPAPEIGQPVSVLVDLHQGIQDPETLEWHAIAEVRELTGADEEYLASLETKPTTTYVDYMSAMLKRTVVNIGGISVSARPDVIEQLIVGDRETLFLAIVKCTYGYEREYEVTCPKCEGKNDVVINLDEDFPMQFPDIDLHEHIKVKLKGGQEVSLRLPNGGDSSYVAKHATTVAAQNTLMLARCLIPSTTVLRGKTPEEWAKSLNVADRSKLIKAILSIKVGPNIGEVNVQCSHCGTNMPLNMTWMSLLFG